MKSFLSRGFWLGCAGVICLALFNGCEKQTSQAPPTDAKAGLSSDTTKPPQTAKTFRLKAGQSSAFTDAGGNVWLADDGFEGGDMIERDPGTMITGTTDPGLYLSEHYGMSAFTCKVPNGRYTARLHFAETFEGVTGPGQRVFSLNVQGHEFKDFDVWAKAGGPNKAYIETIPVEITNGVFHIDFTTNLENPEINALELIPRN